VRFFQGAASQLQAAWAEVQAQGLGNRVLFWEGSFVPRLIRGSATKPSNHAFGTAFDLNAAWNGLRVTPPAAGLKGSVRELVPIFEKHGFFWGGNYRERKDGMHFEVARLGPPAEAAAPLAVAICVNGVHEVIPALFLEGQTWVGVRALVKRLGGEIGQVTAQPFTVTVRNREVQTLAGQSRDGVGYVPFAEVIPLFGYPYEFHAGELRLDITVA